VAVGSPVVLSPWVTHRHPDFWERPDAFEPERFAPERAAGRPHFAYFPFGGGQRQCIGNGFALLEAQLVVATLAQRYRLRPVPGHPIEPEPTVTLRPRHGLPMTLHERAAA
jgi:cytochrome P450